MKMIKATSTEHNKGKPSNPMAEALEKYRNAGMPTAPKE